MRLISRILNLLVMEKGAEKKTKAFTAPEQRKLLG